LKGMQIIISPGVSNLQSCLEEERSPLVNGKSCYCEKMVKILIIKSFFHGADTISLFNGDRLGFTGIFPEYLLDYFSSLRFVKNLKLKYFPSVAGEFFIRDEKLQIDSAVFAKKRSAAGQTGSDIVYTIEKVQCVVRDYDGVELDCKRETAHIHTDIIAAGDCFTDSFFQHVK